MRIPCFVPYVNRPDMLQRLIPLLQCENVVPVVINNSDAPLNASCEVIEAPVPLTFTQSQNWMLRIAKQGECPFYMWAHCDAIPGAGTTQALYERAIEECAVGSKWGVIYTHYDVLSACNTEAMEAVGGYDTAFFDYMSDCDVYRRLALAGYARLESGLECKHDGGSSTIKSDPKRDRVVGIQVAYRGDLYKQKWGGGLGQETFTAPFGGDNVTE